MNWSARIARLEKSIRPIDSGGRPVFTEEARARVAELIRLCYSNPLLHADEIANIESVCGKRYAPGFDLGRSSPTDGCRSWKISKTNPRLMITLHRATAACAHRRMIQRAAPT